MGEALSLRETILPEPYIKKCVRMYFKHLADILNYLEGGFSEELITGLIFLSLLQRHHSLSGASELENPTFFFFF